MWVRVTGAAFGLDRDVYLSVCYFAPESSVLYDVHGFTMRDCFLTLETDIQEFQATGYTLVGGDFNSHVGARNEQHMSLNQLERFLDHTE